MDALVEVYFYTAGADLITDGSKSAVLSMVENLTVTPSTPPTPEVFQKGAEVISNLS